MSYHSGKSMKNYTHLTIVTSYLLCFFIPKKSSCHDLCCKHMQQLCDWVVEKQKRRKPYTNIEDAAETLVLTIKFIVCKAKEHDTMVMMHQSDCTKKIGY